MPASEEAAKPQHPPADTILSPTPPGRAGRREPGPRGREGVPPAKTRPGAPAAALGGRAGRPLPGPASAQPRRRPSRRSRLPGPRGESSCNFAGEAAAGLGLGAGLRPAVRRQAAGAPTPSPARRPPARFVRGGEGRPQAWPPPRAQKGARPAGPGLRGARAGPSRGRGRGGDPGRPRSPAVEPVLAGVALDHEAGNVVGQPADAVHRHRRHVRAARPPAARAALRVGPGGPGRAGAGRAGAGTGDGPGEHDSPRVPAARPHKAGRAQAREPPAGPGRRARVCAGPACGTQKGMDARGRRAAGGEPRPHRRDPRPPSGLYVSAPGGAASACGLAAAPAAEGGPGTCLGEGGPEDPYGDRWAGDPSEGEGALGTCRRESGPGIRPGRRWVRDPG